MQSKPWYTSKTVWAGAVSLASAAARVLLLGEITPIDIQLFSLGLGLIGVRQAID